MATERKRILIVDDDRLVLGLLERVFSQAEFVVEIQTSGREALKSLVDRRPDVVLLDLHMPDVAGIDVLRRMRGDERTKSIPVAVMSARPETLRAAKDQHAGAQKYIEKPSSPWVILREVEALLASRARADEARNS